MDVRTTAQRRSRRRGRRGGIRQRLQRRGCRPPLPPMILSNVQSLRRKMDALRIHARFSCEYRESCIMVFTETWLHRDIPDTLCQLEGFSLLRSDRTEMSGKSQGGGIGIFINDNWCRQYMVRETFSNPDVELLCVSLRPHYLPREFGNSLLCAVYVPPSGNAVKAAAHITATYRAPVFILGDFNHCKLDCQGSNNM